MATGRLKAAGVVHRRLVTVRCDPSERAEAGNGFVLSRAYMGVMTSRNSFRRSRASSRPSGC